MKDGTRTERVLLALLLAGLLGLSCALILMVREAHAAPAGPTKSAVQLQVEPKVQLSLQALGKLRSYGYTWTTDAGALRAIKHWQRVNGLVVDGVVGPQTATSLGLGASATVPAVRLNPPAPPPEPVGVEAIIRSIWPDDLEDKAVAIAWRESNLIPNVRNACCWGLFQIHWKAHRAWLISDFGISSPEQLYDPTTNATVAYALYQRSAEANHGDGWGPWDV